MIFDLIAGTSGSSEPPPVGDQALVIGCSGAPYLQAYEFSGAGLGNPYTAPTAPPTGTMGALLRSNSGNHVICAAAAASSSPLAYNWTDAIGFGSKVTAAPSLTVGYSLAKSAAGTEVFVGVSVTPFVAAWHWTDAGGWGTKYAAPAATLTYRALGVAISPANNAVLTVTATAPRVVAYHWDPVTGFGAAYAAPAELPPADQCQACAFHPSGNFALVASDSYPHIIAYHWDAVTGFGATLPVPSPQLTNAVTSMVFSPDGTAIVIASGSNVVVRSWSNTTGIGAIIGSTKSMINAVRALALSSDGLFLAGGCDAYTPSVIVWPFSSGSGLGTALPAPATPPTVAVRSLTFI